jgi:hypothetical protein
MTLVPPNVSADNMPPSQTASLTSSAMLITNNVQLAQAHVRLIKSPKGALSLKDDVITFTTESGQILCSFNVNSITKMSQRPGVLTIFANETRYMFMFPGWMRSMGSMGAGGLIGLGLAYKNDQNSGIIDWVAALRQIKPDVNMSNYSVTNSMKWTFIIMFGLMALMLLGGVIANIH